MAPYGVVTGTQPAGTMTIQHQHGGNVPGFPPGCGVITIGYNFPSGVQGPEHPHPGVAYSGTSRGAYLPATREGMEVAELLRIAF